MKKKTVSVSVSKERKNHKKFQLLDKILPSESSLKNFYLDAVPFVPIFFRKKKKNSELQANLSQEEREEFSPNSRRTRHIHPCLQCNIDQQKQGLFRDLTMIATGLPLEDTKRASNREKKKRKRREEKKEGGRRKERKIGRFVVGTSCTRPAISSGRNAFKAFYHVVTRSPPSFPSPVFP